MPILPKIVWMLWFQGYENAPEVVKQCRKSWEHFNPDWDVRFLSEQDCRKLLDFDNLLPAHQVNIGTQMRSNFLRARLLEKYGGVWADSTLLCRKPLTAWIPDVLEQGFFVFSKPKPLRPIANWFIASSKGNYLLKTWFDFLYAFFDRQPVLAAPLKGNSDIEGRAIKQKEVPWHKDAFWLAPRQNYEYFSSHYAFSYLLQTDAEFRRQWRIVPPVWGGLPLRLQRYGWNSHVNPGFLRFWETSLAPMHKMAWKLNPEGSESGKILDFVLDEKNW